MNISSINEGSPSAAPSSRQGADVDAKIRSLEQKLQQLNTEREKAIGRKATKEKEKIEKEIKEIEKQIQQLKGRREKETQKESSPDESTADMRETQELARIPSDVGNYVDVFG